MGCGLRVWSTLKDSLRSFINPTADMETMFMEKKGRWRGAVRELVEE